MSEYFDQEKFKKKLKKKIKKNMDINKNTMGTLGFKKGTNPFYFFGMVGSAIYFISTATGFWEGVLGVLKSLVWPAFLVFEALSALGA